MLKAIIITGPTASGKTSLSIKLAQKIDGEIISADSMQIYKSMDIGTAKPTEEEMQGIPHHLIDIIEPTQEFNVVLYSEMAKNCIKEIASRGKIPIITGGTGLYINTLLYNIDFTQTQEDAELREELTKQAEEKGNQYIHEILKSMDPKAAEQIHPNNLKRVIRAIEVYKLTGIARDVHMENSRRKKSEIEYTVIGLELNRTWLYERINMRVDNMISDGLIEEVRRLQEQYPSLSKTAIQAIGYKEIFAYLNNESTKEEAVEQIKKNSRNYAKRQMTWLKRIQEINWLQVEQDNQSDKLLGNTLSIVGKFWEIR